jgi:hypothetical protein
MACEGVIEVAGLAGVLSREPRINYQRLYHVGKSSSPPNEIEMLRTVEINTASQSDQNSW